MQRLMRRLSVTLAYVAMVAMNAAANLLPLNGRTTGDIADQFRIFLTPAGFTFSIWSVIYIGLAAYVFYQWTPDGRSSTRVQRISRPFVISCIANMVWLELWHYGHYVATLAAMLVLLASLVVIYNSLSRTSVLIRAERWCVDVPFSIYIGWVSIATLVNLSVVLDIIDARPGISALSWAIAMVVLATLIGLVVGRRRRDPVYQAVVAWALAGVALKPGQPASLVIAASTGAVILVAHVLLQQLSGKDRR